MRSFVSIDKRARIRNHERRVALVSTAGKNNKDNNDYKFLSVEKIDSSSDRPSQQIKKAPSWGLIIFLSFVFFPVGIYLLVKRLMISRRIKINLTPKMKKMLMVGAGVVIAISILIGGIVALVSRLQKEEDIKAHSISINGTKNGEVVVDCNIVEGSRNCEKIKISGTYTNGSRGYVPIVKDDDMEIILNGDNGFYISYEPSLESSTATIQDKSIKICFSDNPNRHYCPYETEEYPTYNLTVIINVTNEDRERVKVLEDEEVRIKQEEEARKAAEEEQRLKEKNIDERARKLKSCQIATSEWTDEESAMYWNEYLACSNKEYNNAKSSWENTAPSTYTTFELCKKALESAYPYGVKIHYIAGVLADNLESADTRFYKVNVDITNAFGQARSTVAECKAQKDDNNMVKLIYFNVY